MDTLKYDHILYYKGLFEGEKVSYLIIRSMNKKSFLFDNYGICFRINSEYEIGKEVREESFIILNSISREVGIYTKDESERDVLLLLLGKYKD